MHIVSVMHWGKALDLQFSIPQLSWTINNTMRLGLYDIHEKRSTLQCASNCLLAAAAISQSTIKAYMCANCLSFLTLVRLTLHLSPSFFFLSTFTTLDFCVQKPTDFLTPFLSICMNFMQMYKIVNDKNFVKQFSLGIVFSFLWSFFFLGFPYLFNAISKNDTLYHYIYTYVYMYVYMVKSVL